MFFHINFKQVLYQNLFLSFDLCFNLYKAEFEGYKTLPDGTTKDEFFK
jgi:hypothetical protein